MIWPHTKTGEYTVKSGYRIIRKMDQSSTIPVSTATGIDRRIWRIIWQLSIPKKIKIFLWKAIHNILPVRDNLARRKIINSGRCILCDQGNETVEHALLFCPWTRPVWFGVQI